MRSWTAGSPVFAGIRSGIERGSQGASRFGGAVPADDVVKVGEIRFDVPEADGTLTVELAMTSGSVTSTNGYTTTITPP